MEKHIVKILQVERITHDVKSFKIEKPENYSFVPGQATEVAINKPDWENEKRPFTFTSLNSNPYLEFTIKIYEDHEGVTQQMNRLLRGDELIIHDVWGAIRYKGEGTFIAGGAGITPFIAIFRQLKKENKIGSNRLLFSNKTEKDIILRNEFEKLLGDHFVNTLTHEKKEGFDHTLIDKSYLEKTLHTLNQEFYICGPDAMVKDIRKALEELGAGKNVITVEM